MNECMEWTGALGGGRYPHARVGGRDVSVHRYIYEWLHGVKLRPFPADVVMHTCDNTRCINPEHLAVGSQADNIADMVGKGRWRPASKRLQCRRGHPLTPDNVVLNAKGRQCKRCFRAVQKRYKEKRRVA